MNKRFLLSLARFIISASLIIFLLSRANLPQLYAELKSASMWLFLVALLLGFCVLLVSAIRWYVMLRTKGIRISLSALTYFYLVGSFFNSILPTVLGGDVMRGYELARATGRSLDSASTVLMERIVAFFALFVICWVALPFGYQRLQGTNVLSVVVAMSIGFILFALLILNRRIMGRLISLTSFIKRWNVQVRLQAAFESLHSLAESRLLLFNAFVISLIAQFIAIFSTYCISRALDVDVPFTYFLIIMPLIWVITMIPVSISGIGVREGAFVLFFTQQGVARERALALSLLVFAVTVATGIVGGVIYAWGGYRKHNNWPRSGQI